MDHDEEALQNLRELVLSEVDPDIWGPDPFPAIPRILTEEDEDEVIAVLLREVEYGIVLISKGFLLQHLPRASIWLSNGVLDLNAVALEFADRVPEFVFMRVACFVFKALERNCRTGEVDVDMFEFALDKVRSARRYSRAVVALSIFTQGLCTFLNPHGGFGNSELFSIRIYEWCTNFIPDVEKAVGRGEAVLVFDALVSISNGNPGPNPAFDPASGIALHLAPEQHIPDHPGSVVDLPTRPGKAQAQALSSTRELRSIRTNCQFGLREYLTLVRKRQRYDASASTIDLESRIRARTDSLVVDLRVLQSELRAVVKAAEEHRWRRWLVGGALATFIPLVRRIFRRGSDEESLESSNDTEYAFRRSQSLLSRIRDSVFGKGGLAGMAFFVFAVLYVFQNEVSLRVARTIQKRVKKLSSRIERGESNLEHRYLPHTTPNSARFSIYTMEEAASLGDRAKRANDEAKAIPSRKVPGVSENGADRYFSELYHHPPDFKELARLDADFAALAKGRELDFNDAAAVMQLTKTLLKLDFALEIELPDDRLCPPIPNRHNYILWLKGLLDTSSYDPHRQKVGLDIGTGASCIYPLLGCAQRPWSFIATDIDTKSLEWAKKNVEGNDLDSRIKLVKRSPSDALIPLDDLGRDGLDFTMTNPPFYESEQAMVESAAKKAQPPHTVCSGAKVEMVVDGGEIAFVTRILRESLVLRERVQWYTAMFGFLSSLTALVDQLREHKIDNFAVSEFVQGTKTRRWAVAWSFRPMRPTPAIARGIQTVLSKNVMPAVTEVEVGKMPVPQKIGPFIEAISDAVGALDLVSWEWDKEKLEGIGRAVDKVWARAWRRRKKRKLEADAGEELDKEQTTEEQKPLFGFKIWIKVNKDDIVLGCRWLEGHDPVVFESFQGFLKTTAKTASG
ncbi:U6 small nuclear RNA (adenine-(43)-N(6))-methyltransferase [Paramyrothecium foliicola]|nr:U6 small nuclear RNA (adenine-(43)-N(6))-methyltransferase [Paramyrothecium foliicola]